MGVRLLSGDKWGMAREKFSSSEESMQEQIQGENHDYCFFFWQPWHCAQRICISRTRQLITPFTKMSWNDFENGSSESEGTLQTIGCCNALTRQLTLRFQFENFWRRKTCPYFHCSDLAACDFYLFPKLKSKLKGHHFGTIENIQ